MFISKIRKIRMMLYNLLEKIKFEGRRNQDRRQRTEDVIGRKL